MAGTLFKLFLFSLVLIAKSDDAADDDDDEDPIVRISNGYILGRKGNTVGEGVPYYAFQGIPYAKPPIDDLRFEPPEPADDWDDILETQQDQRACLQVYVQDIFNLFGSEDCLYLNVYSTDLSANKSVMVWIHGGADILGSGDSSMYAPDYFLDYDVVVVTLNYRLGILGFLSTEDEVLPGNAGLKDQILALNWVVENIEVFGGNPKDITIFGESSGSVAVHYLLQSPLTEGLFQKAIAQSGTSLSSWGFKASPRELAFEEAEYLNITTEDSYELLEELKQTNASELLKVPYVMLLRHVLSYLSGLDYSPSIEPDYPGAVITQSSYQLLEEGNFHKVPFLTGYNDREGLVFDYLFRVINYQPSEIDEDHTILVPDSMNIEDPLVRQEVGDILYDRFFPEPAADNLEQLADFITSSAFLRGIHKAVELQARHYSDIYFYKFTYQSTLNVMRHLFDMQVPGVSHADELGYFWNVRLLKLEADEVVHRRRNQLLLMWTNFAKTGNPTPNGLPIPWPKVNDAGEENIAFLDIGEELIPGVNPDQDTIDFWENLYADFATGPFYSY